MGQTPADWQGIMLVDVIIVLLILSALVRGRDIGFVQQLLSTIGFFGGLLVGAILQPHTVQLVHGQLNRSLVTLATTLGAALIFLSIGESIGIVLKRKLQMGFADKIDNFLGALLSVVSILLAVWLSASVIKTLPFPGLQTEVRNSKIVAVLTRQLPDAPRVIAQLGHLIDPNGFPQVFLGAEPNLPSHINIPNSSVLAAAVNADKASTVKIIGQGCGGQVDGSGFVAGDDLVITNAHVVAGISRQYVVDANGTHTASAIWFDPNLDLAILRVSNLAGQALVLHNPLVAANTPAAVLGYPGGGGFTANPAAVADHFTAVGSNIYGKGSSTRQVYEVKSDIEPGNSGGPLVAADGSVIGVVFAKSTTYNQVGYALTMQQVSDALNQAIARNTVTSTGSCAE